MGVVSLFAIANLTPRSRYVLPLVGFEPTSLPILGLTYVMSDHSHVTFTILDWLP